LEEIAAHALCAVKTLHRRAGRRDLAPGCHCAKFASLSFCHCLSFCLTFCPCLRQKSAIPILQCFRATCRTIVVYIIF